jgi:Fe-Mn family superoxide dismutase
MNSKLFTAIMIMISVAAFQTTLLAQTTRTKAQAFYIYDATGNRNGFAFPALPYSYKALEPTIDSLTVSIHYDRHHRAYFTKFAVAAKENKLEGKSLEEIFATMSKFPDAVRNNGGGFYNHTLYWENMGPAKGGKPSGALAAAIDKKFGSFDKFKEIYSNAAKSKFGSGWAWLILDPKMELQVTTTSNQDNPLMDVIEPKGAPLLALDVWEHAYYLKYQNKRGDYVDSFWSVVNWDEVSRRYQLALIK